MKKLQLTLFTYLLFVVSLAQAQFQQYYGDVSTDEEFYSGAATATNEYVMFGYTHTAAPKGSDFYLVKTDAQGQQLWQKKWGFTGFDYGEKVLSMQNGDIFVMGAGYNWAADTYQGYYAMLNVSGQEIWQNTANLPLPNVQLIDAIFTSDGNILMLGEFQNANNSVILKLIKIDVNGSIIFNQDYPNLVGDKFVRCYLAEKSNAEILIGGRINGTSRIASIQSNGMYITDIQLNNGMIYGLKTDNNAIYIASPSKVYKYDYSFNQIWSSAFLSYVPTNLSLMTNGNLFITGKNALNQIDATSGNILLSSSPNPLLYGDIRFSIEKNTSEWILGGSTKEFGGRDAVFEVVDATTGLELSHTNYGQVGEERDESARDMCPTDDGGFIMIANDIKNQVTSIKVIKTDAWGLKEWEMDWNNHNAIGVCNTNDGGYILAGYSAGGCETIKLNAQGVLQWTKYYATSYNSANTINGIKPYPTGGYLMACGGYTTSANNTILRLDNNGDTIWVKTYPTTSIKIHDFWITNDGGILFSGLANNKATLIKADSNGNVLWAKDYQFVANPLSIYLPSVTEDTLTGNIYTCGYYTNATTSERESYILKTNALGDSLDIYFLQTLPNMSKLAFEVKVAPTNELVVVGQNGVFSNVHLYIAKFDMGLNLLWEQTYLDWVGMGITTGAVLADGSIVASSSLINPKFLNSYDVFLLKVNSDGSLTSISTKKADFEANIFPNPSENGLVCVEIRRSTSQTLRGEIYDMSGKCLQRNVISSVNSNLDLSGFASGVYFVRILNEKNQAVIQKVVKE